LFIESDLLGVGLLSDYAKDVIGGVPTAYFRNAQRRFSFYHRHRIPTEIISHCVWLYFRFDECRSMPNLEMPNSPRLLKVAELAELLKVKPRTIYEMVAQNRIPYRKPPGSNILRFDLDEILAWTKANTNK
jgi:excisionase family DNA binding protein